MTSSTRFTAGFCFIGSFTAIFTGAALGGAGLTATLMMGLAGTFLGSGFFGSIFAFLGATGRTFALMALLAISFPESPLCLTGFVAGFVFEIVFLVNFRCPLRVQPPYEFRR